MIIHLHSKLQKITKTFILGVIFKTFNTCQNDCQYACLKTSTYRTACLRLQTVDSEAKVPANTGIFTNISSLASLIFFRSVFTTLSMQTLCDIRNGTQYFEDILLLSQLCRASSNAKLYLIPFISLV